MDRQEAKKVRFPNQCQDQQAGADELRTCRDVIESSGFEPARIAEDRTLEVRILEHRDRNQDSNAPSTWPLLIGCGHLSRGVLNLIVRVDSTHVAPSSVAATG